MLPSDGRKANTSLINVTTKPNTNNLSWSKTLKLYLDDIIGEEELISEDHWYNEEIDSDAEVQEVKQMKFQEAEKDTSEVPRTIKVVPVLDPARAEQRNKQKSRQGVWEANITRENNEGKPTLVGTQRRSKLLAQSFCGTLHQQTGF